MTTLPADVARCPGAIFEDRYGNRQWRRGCEDCLRRTAEPIDHPWGVVWMGPPAIIAFECEYRLKPSE